MWGKKVKAKGVGMGKESEDWGQDPVVEHT